MSYSERRWKVVVPVSLALAGTCASASVFVLGDASRTIEASSRLVRTDGGIQDPDSESATTLVTGAWTPPVVDASSIAQFNGRTEAASGAALTHSSDVSELKIGGTTHFSVGAFLNGGFSGYSEAAGRETFSVSFSVSEATPVRLSSDATINELVAAPQLIGQAVLSLASGGQVLSLPLFADGAVETLLQPGDYRFSASSAVTAATFPILVPTEGFDGSYSFSLVVVPEVEQVGLAAGGALLGFVLWRRRAGGR